MGTARLAIYLVGLLLVVGAAWIFLTQTEIGEMLPGGVALALILLLVGIGVMASAKSINDTRTTRRVTYDAPPAVAPPARHDHVDRVVDREVVEERPAGTYVEERRFD